MRRRTLAGLLVVFFMLGLWGFSGSGQVAHAADPTFAPPKSTYYFRSDGYLVTYNGVVKPELMTSILNGKEAAIAAEMVAMDKAHYKDLSITADLDTVGGGANYWDDDPNTLFTNKESTILNLRQGSTVFKIYIPPGVDDEGTPVNQNEIKYAVNGINKLKTKVRRGVLIGSMSSSYNIFKMAPTKQVALSDILEPAKDSSGQPYMKFKSSGVQMAYALDYFFNPIMGKIPATIATAPGLDWFSYTSRVNVTAGNGTDGKSTVDINKDFMRFSQPNSPEGEVVTDISPASVATITRVKGLKNVSFDINSVFTDMLNTTLSLTANQQNISTINGTPKNAVDASVRLTVPYKFNKKLDADKFEIDKTQGYKVVPGYRLSVSRNWVYSIDANGVMKKLGDFATYGIDPDKLIMYTIKDKAPGDKQEKYYPMVMPLSFKEVLGSGKEPLWTGRNIILANSYSSMLQLDIENKDLFAIQSSGEGLAGVKVRNYAFPVNANPKEGKGNDKVTTPDTFSLQAGFVSSTKVKGFTMYLNSQYANDPALSKWLETTEAAAITGVDADTLKSKVSSTLSVKVNKLSYAEWNRIAQIKAELDVSFTSKLLSFVRVLAIVFGAVLVFFSVILVIMYWIDIFIMDMVQFSLVRIVTFGRLYPVVNKDQLTLMGVGASDNNKVKYVTFPYVALIAISAVAIGMLFMYLSPIMNLFAYMYYTIMGWVGM